MAIFLDNQKPKKKVYKSIRGNSFDSKQAALQDNKDAVKNGEYYIQKGSNIIGVDTKVVRRNPNTSSTKYASQNLENGMYTQVDRRRKMSNYRTKPYDIPYGDRILKIKPKGATIYTTIPVNALDSLAKYAGITKTPIQTALGLAMQETNFGKHPFYNYGKLGNNYTSRDLGNANYFKAFGSIPAEYLVRDFRYNDDGVGQGKHPISLTTPPLQHAMEYFNSGNYNRGDPNHTNDVLKAGSDIWNETTNSLQDWWNNEGKRFYYNTK